MKVIYEERTLEFVENGGDFLARITVPTAFIPTNVDRVTWDGVEYELPGVASTQDGIIYATGIGGDETPFTMINVGAYAICFASNDTEVTSHTLSIALISEGDLKVMDETVMGFSSGSGNDYGQIYFSSDVPQFYPGAEYTITFQGKKYDVYAKIVQNESTLLYGVGSTLLAGLSWTENGLPFVIGSQLIMTDGGNVTISCFGITTDWVNETNEYRFGIELKSLLNEPSGDFDIVSADVVLKDRNGNDCTFTGVKAIKMDTPKGEPQYFVAVEGVPTL